MELDPTTTPRPPLRVGLLGCGTVGAEVARILTDPGVPAFVLERVAVRAPHKERAIDLDPAIVTTDPLEVVKDPEIDVVVELIGGMDLARGLLRQAIAERKDVVTANKLVVGLHGAALRRAAAEQGVNLLYEGAVCGALPAIRTLRHIASVDRVTSLAGVINGTVNFVLSELELGSSLDAAVAAAQALGYAEADPSIDLDAIDAACKLSVLCSHEFGVEVPVETIDRRGVDAVTRIDALEARGAGRRLRLVAEAARRPDGSVAARIAPRALPATHPLARVDGVENGLLIRSDLSGELSLFGPGAGGRATAAAVAADLEEIARCRQVARPRALPAWTKGRTA